MPKSSNPRLVGFFEEALRLAELARVREMQARAEKTGVSRR